MARAAGKKQAPAKIEDDDDDEGWEESVVDTEAKEAEADLRLRDWRDVERYREMKELRRLVDDDYGLEEIFLNPLKPRAVGATKAVAAAKAPPPKAPPAKGAAKPPAKAAAPAAPKKKAEPQKKLKAKAKRR